MLPSQLTTDVMKRHQIGNKIDVKKERKKKRSNMQIKLMSKTSHYVDLM